MAPHSIAEYPAAKIGPVGSDCSFQAQPPADPDLSKLPEELLLLLLVNLSEKELCALSCTCTQFRRFIAKELEPLWAMLYRKRWMFPPWPRAVVRVGETGWRSDYKRRHLLDARVIHLLRNLSSTETRNDAWLQLLDLGEEVYDRVLEIADESMDSTITANSGQTNASKEGVTAEAWKTLRALNQSIVRREWEDLRAQATISDQLAHQTEQLGSAPSVEDGALLLVRFYLSGEDLRSPHDKIRQLSDEITQISSRLASRLEPGFNAVQAVRTLASMLFEEEGFSGNSRNYYDYRNSLLDHVIESVRSGQISARCRDPALCFSLFLLFEMRVPL